MFPASVSIVSGLILVFACFPAGSNGGSLRALRPVDSEPTFCGTINAACTPGAECRPTYKGEWCMCMEEQGWQNDTSPNLNDKDNVDRLNLHGYISCVPKDECSDASTNECPVLGGVCVDLAPGPTPGVDQYKCGCASGFEADTNSTGPFGPKACLPIATTSCQNCAPEEICASLPDGSFECLLPEPDSDPVDEEKGPEAEDEKDTTPVLVCGSPVKPCNLPGQYCEGNGSNNCFCKEGWFQSSGQGGTCKEVSQCEQNLDTECDQTGRGTPYAVSKCIEVTVAQHPRGYKCECLPGFVAVANTEAGTDCEILPSASPTGEPSSAPATGAPVILSPMPTTGYFPITTLESMIRSQSAPSSFLNVTSPQSRALALTIDEESVSTGLFRAFSNGKDSVSTQRFGAFPLADSTRIIRRYALRVIYFSMVPSNTPPAFMTGDDECNWEFVECKVDGHLNGLTVSVFFKEGYKGSLPPELGLLSTLTFLQIDKNPNMTGSLPTELGLLTNLASLSVSYNHLLIGSIPSELSRLTKLSALTFESNAAMTGSIPPTINLLTSLATIHMAVLNNLHGSIPSEIGLLPSLKTMILRSLYSLKGSIPSEIGLLPSLEALTISNNDDLEGTIPTEMGSLPKLTSLVFSDNDEIAGTIPTEMGSLPKLALLAFNNNDGINGTIPSEMGLLPKLTSLSFAGNDGIKGTIPTEMGSLPKLLSFLFINNDGIIGTIPSEMGSLPLLQTLQISYNDKLGGSIPSEIGLMPELRTITMIGNDALTGTIPTEIGLSNLTKINFGKHKKLRGVLPSEFGLIAVLNELFIQENNAMSGSIPSELGLITRLYRLVIHKNEGMSGAPLPSEFGMFQRINSMTITNQGITGTIPSELGLLHAVDYLYLQNNELSGTVPNDFADLTTIWKLSLQGNKKLVGGIPSDMCNLNETIHPRSIYYNAPLTCDCPLTNICKEAR